MSITDRHPQHDNMATRWKRCRDVVGGSDSVKAAGTAYLPIPPGMDRFDGSYAAYVARALFYNAMSRTVDGLAGSIFQKAPTVNVPHRVEPMLADITLTDESLDGFALHVTREVLTVGRCPVLVDHAAARPYLAAYRAEDLISWHVERRDDDPTLVRAVLREYIEEPDEEDPSKIKQSEQYRELLLTPDGEYQVRLWVKLPRAHLRDTSSEVWIATDPIVPVRRGSRSRSSL